ncbi:MAG: mannitol dehydrogenase family protein [Negativicutes bacterium]|nr:mannitol dehydrogenase family protein [Negativicutes bacterium]
MADGLSASPAAVTIRHPDFCYQRQTLPIRQIHLGFSAFFRAHLMSYIEDANRYLAAGWGVAVVKTRAGNDSQFDSFIRQHCVYTLVETSRQGEEWYAVGSVVEAIKYPQGQERLWQLWESDKLSIVSMTLTEKGYCYDLGNRCLDWDNAELAADLEQPGRPRSAIGILVHGLYRRWQLRKRGITLLSCDNLPGNGQVLKQAVIEFAERIDKGFQHWIEQQVAFPDSMVDRIVPAMDENGHRRVAGLTGYEDPAAIVCEKFRQWVVTDNFAADRPAWEQVGAQMVSDVAPYGEMKLRMLNGSHSLIAYTGYLEGKETVDRAMEDPALRKMVTDFWRNEAKPSMARRHHLDYDRYADSLAERFVNPQLGHRTWQIAMDGSKKLPYRWLNTIRDLLELGLPFPSLSRGIACWIKYTGGYDLAGNEIDVRDPLREKFAAIHRSYLGDGGGILGKYLGLTEIFGDDLSSDPRLYQAVLPHLLPLVKQRL